MIRLMQSIALDQFVDNCVIVGIVFAVCCIVFGIAAYITRDDV